MAVQEPQKEIAEILLDIGAISFNTTDPFTYSSGMRSPMYCDNRLLISYPEKRKRVAELFATMLHQNNIDYDVIAGTATAGIPHAAWLADILFAPMIYVRGSAKEHGHKNQIEGRLDEGAHALIVEDVVSTGGSAIDASESVKAAGGVVLDCIAIFSYEMEVAQEKFRKAGVDLHTLTTFSALLTVAVERGDITEEEKESIIEWQQDPQGWATKKGIE